MHLRVETLTEAEAHRLAAPILAKRFERFGFDRLEVTDEHDFDGDPILRMIVYVRDRVPTEELVDAIDEVRTALLEAGEDRFVSLRTASPDDDEIEEDVED